MLLYNLQSSLHNFFHSCVQISFISNWHQSKMMLKMLRLSLLDIGCINAFLTVSRKKDLSFLEDNHMPIFMDHNISAFCAWRIQYSVYKKYHYEAQANDKALMDRFFFHWPSFIIVVPWNSNIRRLRIVRRFVLFIPTHTVIEDNSQFQ